VHCAVARPGPRDARGQYDHPDLKANVWHNSDEVKNNGKDDDKNGYVDDYYGADLIDKTGSGGDGEGHGTHVAGIIGAQTGNALGVSGLCWSSSLVAAKFMDDRGRGSTSDAVDGIDYAVHVGAKIINCSFGSSSKSSAMESAIEHAGDKGVLLVVAAGNSSENVEKHPIYPASYTYGNLLVVASITSTGALSSFSNYGSSDVDLGAPGSNILSTYPGSKYHVLSGTSMAAPIVAATAAMIRKANSDVTVSQIRAAIKDTVTPSSALAGKTLTGGRLNVPAALKAGS
jgi:subtilisin family serine protease